MVRQLNVFFVTNTFDFGVKDRKNSYELLISELVYGTPIFSASAGAFPSAWSLVLPS